MDPLSGRISRNWLIGGISGPLRNCVVLRCQRFLNISWIGLRSWPWLVGWECQDGIPLDILIS